MKRKLIYYRAPPSFIWHKYPHKANLYKFDTYEYPFTYFLTSIFNIFVVW